MYLSNFVFYFMLDNCFSVVLSKYLNFSIAKLLFFFLSLVFKEHLMGPSIY